MKRMMSFQVDDAMWRDLKEVAEREFTSMGSILRRAAHDLLERYRDRT